MGVTAQVRVGACVGSWTDFDQPSGGLSLLIGFPISDIFECDFLRASMYRIASPDGIRG